MNSPENNFEVMRQKLNMLSTDQIGMVRKKCFDHGITALGEIADAYEAMRQLQIQAGTWGYENFTRSGSDSAGYVESAGDAKIQQDCVIWPINHYLALNRHPEVIKAAHDALESFGAGCGTSAMSGGHNALHKKLENRLADILKKEAAILFPTGYSANVGAISALGRGSSNVILFDRECHASIIDGVKLAGCKFIPFKHNAVDDLERKLEKYSKDFDNVIVIVESVYSMSGEESPLQAIVELKDKHKFYLFVDEAHSFGLYENGSLCGQLGITDDVDFIMTTLSKSAAAIGGVVATSRAFMTLLQLESTAYMFQAALTPPDTAAVLTALDIIDREPEIVRSLWEKTRYFRNALIELGFDVGNGTSPIIAVYIRDSEVLFKFAKLMFGKGIFTTAVTYPAVKNNEVRFRFIVNQSHTYEQINHTLSVLSEVGKALGVIQ